ncbi:MAG: DUF3014 domain-containing protein [SAR86 cluster bacterium]|uniref:DUF3014 domain-containing protein n=1 Tax=SAR86 cluster bacterium TaxID=2030880 RepID=A0A973A9Z9_9GAMM|nr:DUF3014 domain-containing protein [SAR86 cluster bacterium]
MSENKSESLSESTSTTAAAKPIAENKPILIALVVVGLLICGLVAYLVTTSEPESEVVSQPLVTKETAPAIPEPEPETVVEVAVSVIAEPTEALESAPPAFVLPRLDDSDQLIRDGLLSLTREEAINVWLSPDELVRKFVVLVDNAANGNVAKDSVAVLMPDGPFLATPLNDTVYVMDEGGYTRYDTLTRIFTSLDSRRAAEFYQLLNPLFKDAYDELGYADKQFEDMIFQAVGRILETPVLEEPARLVRPVVMYRFEDASLESLSPIQKQLVRMGPKNTRAIQAKVGEMARELRQAIVGRP